MNNIYTPYIISTVFIIFFIGINTYIIEEDEITWNIIAKQFIILFIIFQTFVYLLLNIEKFSKNVTLEKPVENIIYEKKISDPNSIYLGPPKFNRF